MLCEFWRLEWVCYLRGGRKVIVVYYYIVWRGCGKGVILVLGLSGEELGLVMREGWRYISGRSGYVDLKREWWVGVIWYVDEVGFWYFLLSVCVFVIVYCSILYRFYWRDILIWRWFYWLFFRGVFFKYWLSRGIRR